MHVEIRKEGKKRKYFLAHSYREGDKVHKFRKYLGQDLKKSLLEERKNIAEELIKRIHKIVFKNSKSFAGQLRKKGEEVVVMGGGIVIHEGAPQARINHLLNKLVEWYELNKNKYPALILSAVIHNQFENIHPFRDGNGRVGRILMNNILIKHGLPPVNIDLKNRKKYYQSLQEYENNHNIRPAIELLLEEYKELRKK